MDELDPALAATIAAIPEWDGLEPEVTPITIGIDEPQLPGGDRRRVVRRPPLGQGHRPAGHRSRGRERGRVGRRPAGVAPEVFAYLPEHRLPDHPVRPGLAHPRRGLEQRRRAREPSSASSRRSTRARRSRRRSTCSASWRTTGAIAEARGVDRRRPRSTRRTRRPGASSGVRGARRCRTAPVPQRPARRQLPAGRRSRLARRLRVRRDGRPVLRPREPVDQQRPRREARRSCCSGCTSATSRTRHRARLQLMRIMSDFREAMWGVVQQGDVDAGLRLRGVRRAALRRAVSPPHGGRAVRGVARGGRRGARPRWLTATARS